MLVHRQDATLCVQVEDNGPGFRNERETGGHGIGLTNTRDRIERLYGSRGSVEIASSPEGGASVLVKLPFRLAEAITP